MQVTSGRPAASDRLTPAGTGSSCPAGTATFSAYPPPLSSAHTWSPTAQPSTPSPSAAMRPEHSSPGYGGAPGGGGYMPMRCIRSARLTPAPTISTTASPGPATGSGTSASCRTSGPPGSEMTTARMRALPPAWAHRRRSPARSTTRSPPAAPAPAITAWHTGRYAQHPPGPADQRSAWHPGR